MKFKVARLCRVDTGSAVKAHVDIVIDDVLIIKGFSVVEGRAELFVSAPKDCGKDGRWYSTVIHLKRDVKDELERIIMEAYNGNV